MCLGMCIYLGIIIILNFSCIFNDLRGKLLIVKCDVWYVSVFFILIYVCEINW